MSMVLRDIPKLMDEATSGLDPIIRDEILDVFLEFIQDESHSIFISSHITSDLEKICDYITFIYNGRILLSDIKDEILERYKIIKCSKQALKKVDKKAIIGVRENAFGVQALVLKEYVDNSFIYDNPSLEDIMLYFIKEDR